MSTLVITSHVKEGLSLALLHKLPDVILKAIREHHGTGILSCFHHKARSQMESGPRAQNGNNANGVNQLDDGAFRYPGPRPSSRRPGLP